MEHEDGTKAERKSGANDDVLLTTEQVADWLKVSTQFLEIGRSKRYGPKFIKLGRRCIRYMVGHVREYLRERAHACTAEYGAEAKHVGRRRTTRRGAPAHKKKKHRGSKFDTTRTRRGGSDDARYG